MQPAYLEHTNLTVADPDKFAALLCNLFDWKIRWSGPSLDDGYTVHVGRDECYLALYTPVDLSDSTANTHANGNLNHIGIVVDNLEAIENKVRQAGLTPFGHRDYEPGRRFYVKAIDDIELEIVSYD